MYFVYVLYSPLLKKRYVSSTNNVERRLKEHNNGKNRFTKGGIPWRIIFIEEFETRSKAMHRKIFLKSGMGRKFLDENLKVL